MKQESESDVETAREFARMCLTTQPYRPITIQFWDGRGEVYRSGWNASSGMQVIIATGPGFTAPKARAS